MLHVWVKRNPPRFETFDMEGIEELEEQLKAMRQDGMAYQDIANTSGVSYGKAYAETKNEAVNIKNDNQKSEIKAKLARRLYGKSIDDVIYRTSELAVKLGAGKSTVREWVRTQREDEKTERQKKALDLYLQCLTQQEIAEKLGWSQQIISNDLAELTKNGKSAENGKPDPLRFADVWSFVEREGKGGIVGRSSFTIVGYPTGYCGTWQAETSHNWGKALLPGHYLNNQ